jgi:hypothetical protein
MFKYQNWKRFHFLFQKESKLQQQRINTVAEELELREAATRQKLHEFKEKLRMFRESRSSPGLFNSLDKTFNSSGYESLPLSNFNGLNTTDSDKSEFLASFASQKNIAKLNAEQFQNGDSLNEGVVSAFKPYKGSGKIVPKSGWLDGKSDIVQNGYLETTGQVCLKDGHIENGAEVLDRYKAADIQDKINSGKTQSDQVPFDNAFKNGSSLEGSGEVNNEKSEKVAGADNYPFIKATLQDHENIERMDKSKFGSFNSERKSAPLFSKPPLPNRQESVTNGWTGDQSRQHQFTADKWNNVYSPESSRPSTGNRWRSSSLTPKANEKHVPDSEKWNSGTASRPSSGNSLDVFSNNGDGSGKWDVSYRIGSPTDSWSGVRPADILRTKSASPNDFAQRYDTDGLLGDIPLLVKSNSIDVCAGTDDSNILKEFVKTARKSDLSKRNHDRRSKHYKKDKNRRNVTNFDDFRNPPTESKTLSFPEPVSNKADDTYLPSEVYTRNDLRKMSLQDKCFNSALNSMLNGGCDSFRATSAPVTKKTTPKSALFGKGSSPNYLFQK